jgi:predicted nucleic acid-binding protein
MTTILLLDASILGAVTNPKTNNLTVRECQSWFDRCLEKSTIFVLPEIADYEIRRELIRANKINGINRLDQLKSILQYQPIDTQTMILAAQLWAESRQRGTPTCDPRELDGDVILAAQAKQLEALGYEIIIVTTNIGHLSQFVTAKLWQDC